ncbi:MAG: hypothetical protein J2P48_18335 [Alphaproteobacteria bacterium]|nr:hypothetical protein [Alphaproteobacteria bacterium]
MKSPGDFTGRLVDYASSPGMGRGVWSSRSARGGSSRIGASGIETLNQTGPGIMG